MLEPDEEDPLVQMNVRVPRSVVDQVNTRRAESGLSQSKWVTRALKFTLAQPRVQPKRPGRPTLGRSR